MIDIVTEEYRKIIENNEKKVIVFSAPWCAPCRMFKPVLDNITKELGVPFYAVNIDESPELASELGIRSVPTTFIYNNCVQSFPGVKPADEVKALLA